MTLWCRTGLLLLLAMQPLVLAAADIPAVPLIARGDRNFPPYEFINENGEPDGFNIDLLKAISRRLEMNVDIGLDAWETVREAFTNGNIHLVTGMIRSAEREKHFDFSITHAGVFYCLFVRKGSSIQNIDDARGKQILVHAQAYSQDWLVDRETTDQIIPVSSPQEALQMLADGRYDCAVIERLSALMLMNHFKIDNVALAGPALLYVTPVLSGGSQTGLRGLLVDITFQKELEKQVIESQKLEALGRLAGGVAHDFNNIITGISGYAQLIRAQPQRGEAVADSSEKILTGCDHASDLVRHFLTTAGRRHPEKQRVRVGQLVSEIFKLLQPTYGLNITFHNTIGDQNDAVWAEPAPVFQVLMNLCVNGAQAMSGKGGALTAGLVDSAPTAREASNMLPQRVFFITDTGPGIEPDLLERIFEPFFTTRSKDKGTGIGLFVVCQALADMGGAIRVESQPGKGATFIVTLPAAPSPA